jgi:hypothetical protein
VGGWCKHWFSDIRLAEIEDLSLDDILHHAKRRQNEKFKVN